MDNLKQIIDNLVEFTYSCGGYFDGYDTIKIVVEYNSPIKLIFMHSTKRDPLDIKEISNDIFEQFKKELYDSIKNWDLKYVDNTILDGTQWSLDLVGLDGTMHYYGSNNYPNNWENFTKLIDKLKKEN